jgi:hypothetical protein
MEIESLNDALIECVKAAGGSKTVASILWPEKPLNDAQRLLLACLNTERSEKLCPNQTLLILKLAKDAGSHVGINFICNSLNYSVPTPIEPEDEKAQLMREFIQAQKAMTQLADKLSHVGLKAVA